MARGEFDGCRGRVILDADPAITERFQNMCNRKGVQAETMFETMVRSFDRGQTTYGLDMRMDFGKYAGMNVEDVIRTDTRYMRWLINASEWFRLDSAAERLLKTMEG
jgi:hypothetical protein